MTKTLLDKTINLRLPARLHAQLQRESVERDISVGKLVRHFLHIQFQHEDDKRGE